MERIVIGGKTQAKLDGERTIAAQQTASDEARACLRDTDWYVLRLVETGAEIPDEIREKRQAARGGVTP